MGKRIYAITGATGNVGGVVSETLLQRGFAVRAIGRSEERLRPLAHLGAEVRVGSLEDAGFVEAAFEKAAGVFAMIPPNYVAADFSAYQEQIAERLASGVSNTGVSHVVTLSSVGAHLAAGTGPIKGLHKLEERFNQLREVNIVHLRPASFMENLFFGLDTIKSMGINGSALKPDLPIAMIATKDIGAVAADLLANLNFSGKSARELLGPSDITMTEATRALGEAIGKADLKYVQFPYEDVRQALAGLGMSASAIDELIELYEAVNDGLVQPSEQRSPLNTTPTTIEEFSQTFAQAFHSGAAATAS
ncbi:MAG TPA: NAD(P)H-binding protein [Pyrinomonadaceae bacterium]|nr:NAD(P)H-binding protein [Pyrinomonadaceae bacterium]